MITSGFKFWFGLGAAAFVAAIVYGWTSGGADWDLFPGHLGDLAFNLLGPLTFGYKGAVGDHLGYSVLMGLSLGAFAVGGLLVVLRDGDGDVLAAQAGTVEAPQALVPVNVNWWAPLSAFAAAAIVLGLVVTPLLLIAGIVVAAIVALEWTMDAWTDRASTSADAGRGLRNGVMSAIEFPILGTLVVGFVVISFSRVLLALPKLGSSIAAVIFAGLVFGVGALLASRPEQTRSIAVGALVVLAIGVLASGVVGVALGEREFEHHGEEHSEEGTGATGEGEGAGAHSEEEGSLVWLVEPSGALTT